MSDIGGSTLDLVFVWTRDLERATTWYATVLGRQPSARDGEWQTFELPDGPGLALHGTQSENLRGTVVGMRCHDLEATIARLAEQGILPNDEITDIGSGRFATYTDPDGNALQLIERRDRLTGAQFAGLIGTLGDAWEALDTEAAVACFTSDAVYMQPPDQQLFRGHDELRAYFSPLRSGTSFRVEAWWFNEGAQRGAIEFVFGLATDDEADHGVAVVDVTGGRIARWREYLQRGPADTERFSAVAGKQWRWHAGNYP